MRFLVDENIPHVLAAHLAGIYLDHAFVSAFDEAARYCGVDDVDLFPRLIEDGFDAIVTRDKNQLADAAEKSMLRELGLRWIGHQAKEWPGLRGIVLTVATLTAGLFYVLEDWQEEPHAYHLRGVEAQPGQRMKSHPI
ncbi:MAG TPA: hypothetical protein PLZ93_02175 [Nocardioides sp.]|uniref:PIN-like domain-containing protein n=1 Tax=uncultured Nocardioides sp. TaxID=198441 RepID=UPI000EDDCF43|nr:hypothetical protein [uncultured Nocardioides sp.]HCB07646.1 hypothetical protein [Nocardioides sp.]HRD60288.1 hypothetical protein [Nocardioides sp.]HRI94402.1 hypothetical protein [Nocardioides sp.]HRK44775.1 hypothetical protein [Nocardioides sp.]